MQLGLCGHLSPSPSCEKCSCSPVLPFLTDPSVPLTSFTARPFPTSPKSITCSALLHIHQGSSHLTRSPLLPLQPECRFQGLQRNGSVFANQAKRGSSREGCWGGWFLGWSCSALGCSGVSALLWGSSSIELPLCESRGADCAPRRGWPWWTMRILVGRWCFWRRSERVRVYQGAPIESRTIAGFRSQHPEQDHPCSQQL